MDATVKRKEKEPKDLMVVLLTLLAAEVLFAIQMHCRLCWSFEDETERTMEYDRALLLPV